MSAFGMMASAIRGPAMTIDDIEEWFQLAAQAMFASVALGPERGGWTFYPCEPGPGCAWPQVVH